MIPEMVLKAALEEVIGQGFKAVVEHVFRHSRGKSDRQILEAVLVEVRRHGGQIGNLDVRIAQLEREIARLQLTSSSHASHRVFSPENTNPSGTFVDPIFPMLANKTTAELIDIFGLTDGGATSSPLVYMSRGFQIYLANGRADRVSFYRKGYRGSAGYETDVIPGLRPSVSLAYIEGRFGLPNRESCSYGRWYARYDHIAPPPFGISVTYSHEYKTPEAIAESLSLILRV